MKLFKNFPELSLFLLAGIFFQQNFSFIRVDGDSMNPGFRNGDLVLVWRGAYLKSDPARGDVVVAQARGDLIIKRVLGLPGEIVEIKSGTLWINESPLTENYPLQPGNAEVGKGELSAGKFALFGDNRNVAKDQMIAAVTTRTQLLGKVLLVANWGGAKNFLGIGTHEETVSKLLPSSKETLDTTISSVESDASHSGQYALQQMRLSGRQSH